MSRVSRGVVPRIASRIPAREAAAAFHADGNAIVRLVVLVLASGLVSAALVVWRSLV